MEDVLKKDGNDDNDGDDDDDNNDNDGDGDDACGNAAPSNDNNIRKMMMQLGL